VTDDIARYGLGALPDAPDERDYPVSALYAAEGLTASVVLPASYAAPGMPLVLDQHATPMCVACSSSALKAWQDRRDQERFFDFAEPRPPWSGLGLRQQRRSGPPVQVPGARYAGIRFAPASISLAVRRGVVVTRNEPVRASASARPVAASASGKSVMRKMSSSP